MFPEKPRNPEAAELEVFANVAVIPPAPLTVAVPELTITDPAPTRLSSL